MIEIDDVEEALLKADELAEITGRDKKDIIADLLDDGQLNMSAGEDTDKKDILDIAQEKVDKLKALLMTLLPVFALIVGGTGFEMFGVTNFSPMGDDDNYMEIYGCTDPSAINYMYDATMDDGYCEYETEYEDVYGCTNDASQNYNLEANIDDGSCIPIEETIEGCTDSEADNYNSDATEDDGSCEYPPPPCQWIIWRGEAGDNDTAPLISHDEKNNTTTLRYDIDENKNCGEYTIYVDLYAVNGAGDFVDWANQTHNIYGQVYENDTLTLYNLSCNQEYDLHLYLYDPDQKAADNIVFYNVKREC